MSRQPVPRKGRQFSIDEVAMSAANKELTRIEGNHNRQFPSVAVCASKPRRENPALTEKRKVLPPTETYGEQVKQSPQEG